MRKKLLVGGALLLSSGIFLLSGCVHAQPNPGPEISPDVDPLAGGINSADVRTVASKMCPAILAVPEITEAAGVTRIKIADFKNTSRFFIDKNIFMKRLTVELNRHSRGKIRFLNNNAKVQVSRSAVLSDRMSALIQQNLKAIAKEIAASPILKDRPIKVAVIPVLNTNLVNMNADSFTAMLRSEIFNAAAGRVQFLMPGVIEGADYYLTGQFIPETMKTEGIINLANYIEVVDARVKAGKSLTAVAPASQQVIIFEKHLKQMLNDPAMRANPNVNKRLNIMLVDTRNKTSVYEKMILLDCKVSDNSGIANYIISGEISGMHKRKNGVASDYLLFTIQLTNPDTNEVIWEDAYEVKRLTQNGIVYR